jgi:hypothetical protein
MEKGLVNWKDRPFPTMQNLYFLIAHRSSEALSWSKIRYGASSEGSDRRYGKGLKYSYRFADGSPHLKLNGQPFHRSSHLNYSEWPNKIVIARSVATRQSHEIASLRSQ